MYTREQFNYKLIERDLIIVRDDGEYTAGFDLSLMPLRLKARLLGEITEANTLMVNGGGAAMDFTPYMEYYRKFNNLRMHMIYAAPQPITSAQAGAGAIGCRGHELRAHIKGIEEYYERLGITAVVNISLTAI